MDEIRAAIPEDLLYHGRPGDPRLGEWVQRINSPRGISKAELHTIVLMGCADDQGVILNRGRAGAEDGPNSIRKHFYRMTPPMDREWEKSLALFDFGNVLPAEDILDTHARARFLSKEIAANGGIVITFGGGHDFAAPTLSGFAEGTAEFTQKVQRVGLMNLDPHLDVRELEHDRPHSGTPFRQLIEAKVLSGPNLIQFGARKNRNSRQAYAFCQTHKVKIFTLDQIRALKSSAIAVMAKTLAELTKKCTVVGLTIDMDCCSDAEGTSAAPVIGFTATELISMAYAAGRQPRVRFLEIAEVAPPLDPTERSSRIAAEIVYAFLLGKSEISNPNQRKK